MLGIGGPAALICFSRVRSGGRMNGVELITAQLVVTHQIHRNLILKVEPEEWAARPAPGMNMPGYTLWHIAATQDWVAHVATRGLPELRTQARWGNHPGINPDLPPFGCTLEQADAVAHATTPADVLEYARDVHVAMLAWLNKLGNADLDVLPDLMANTRHYPASRCTAAYLAEIADQTLWSLARFLASPCIGHARGHFGELDVQLALLRMPR